MTIPQVIHIMQQSKSDRVLGEVSFNQAYSQDIFRRVSPNKKIQTPKEAKTTPPKESSCFWNPPIYRNVTMLSSPSRDLHDSKENIANGGLPARNLDIPWEFVPPKHDFSQSPDRCNAKTLRQETVIHRTVSHDVLGKHHSNDSSTFWPKDIVCGRGAPTLHHPGNKAYRALIKKYEADYLCAKRSDKPRIAMKVMDILHRRGARFVKRENGGKNDQRPTSNQDVWVELEESRAYEKVCQSLREYAPEIRRKMLASDARHNMVLQQRPGEEGLRRTMTAASSHSEDCESYSPIPCF